MRVKRGPLLLRVKVTDADPKVFDNLTRDQRRALMASLLSERLHLKLHPATKILPVYDLVLAGPGPRFSESTSDTAEPHVVIRKTEYTATGSTMPGFASFLEEVVGRSVLDKTGLTGKYDLHLKWTEDLTNAPASDPLPSIFTALQEQLGLRLQPNKGPVKTLVVDHLDRPPEN